MSPSQLIRTLCRLVPGQTRVPVFLNLILLRHAEVRKELRPRSLRGLAMAAFLMTASYAHAGENVQEVSDEQQMGTSIYQGYKANRQIIESSPLYDLLEPVGRDVVRVAQPRYGLPIRIWLIHDPRPNAFAAPGGNIYVTDELLYLIKNQEELAGTLCHEVSHLIHHDSEEMLQKQRQVLRRELGASVLLGASGAVGIALIGKLHSLHYSREVESRADLTGADVCAASGHNPWGLVWLFGAFGQANVGEGPEFLSDHPDNLLLTEPAEDVRVRSEMLSQRFNAAQSTALSLAVPANAVFLR
jgi:beta-barrel assembly-enhancing protease